MGRAWKSSKAALMPRSAWQMCSCGRVRMLCSVSVVVCVIKYASGVH